MTKCVGASCFGKDKQGFVTVRDGGTVVLQMRHGANGGGGWHPYTKECEFEWKPAFVVEASLGTEVGFGLDNGGAFLVHSDGQQEMRAA